MRRTFLFPLALLALCLALLPALAYAQTGPSYPDDPRSNLELWSLVVAFLLPLVISVVQQPSWPDALRASVTFVACILAALGTTYFQGRLHIETLDDLLRSFLLIFIGAIATYSQWWKRTGVAPAIERATAPRRTHRP